MFLFGRPSSSSSSGTRRVDVATSKRRATTTTAATGSVGSVQVVTFCPSNQGQTHVVDCPTCCRNVQACPSYQTHLCGNSGTCDTSTGACACTSETAGYVTLGSCCQFACADAGTTVSNSSVCCSKSVYLAGTDSSGNKIYKCNNYDAASVTATADATYPCDG